MDGWRVGQLQKGKYLRCGVKPENEGCGTPIFGYATERIQ